ncbi:MAG TPA: hypothetical protein PKD91_04875 [Bacteroidia bacterium]|nr:hypothetical protein [Bacteroidia bacterium]
MKLTDGFLIKLGIFSLTVAVIFFFLEPVFPAKMVFKNHIYIQLFMMTVTYFFHTGLIRAGQKSDQAFIRFFMGATGIKLFLFMVIMILYGLTNKETAFGFILHLFLYYLLYTVFEVALVYRKFSGVKRSS